jgi:hypothetical protein
LPPETIDAFSETSVECSQYRYLVFDISAFVLIESQLHLFTDRQWLWNKGIPCALEDLLDLLCSEAKTQVHLDRLHTLDGLLIEVAIAILQPTSAQHPFLFIIAQGTNTHSCAVGYFANTHESLSFPECYSQYKL